MGVKSFEACSDFVDGGASDEVVWVVRLGAVDAAAVASKVKLSTVGPFEADRRLRKLMGDRDLIICLIRLFGDACGLLLSTGTDIGVARTGILGL